MPAILLAGARSIGQTRHASADRATAPHAPPGGTSSSRPRPAPSRRRSARSSRRIIKEILLNNPEILLEAQNALEAKMDKIQAERMAVAIKEHAGELFRPAGSPVVGNAKGDVPVIEFFDYNCGYCKKAFPDVAKLMDKDKKVRVILKEFPILAKGSEEASTRRARRQDAGQILGVPSRHAARARARPTRPRRCGSPRSSASTWPGSRRTWPRPR